MSHPDPRTAQLAAAYDPDFEPSHDNPHAHHGHFIVPGSTLLLVFIALLAFTFLTVGAAKAEETIAHWFGIIIPQWINVVIALSIAIVKTALVIGFFMQLRYDNPLNTMVFAFTVVCVLVFFGFTITDMANRATIDRFKARYIVSGGTGLPTTYVEAIRRSHPEVQIPSDKQPITVTTREVAEQVHSPLLAEAMAHARHEARAATPPGSTADRSRPLKGLTGLTTESTAPHDGHGGADHAPASGH